MPLTLQSTLNIEAIEGFYSDILKNALGYELRMPEEMTSTPEGALRWLGLVDLAVSATMIRDVVHKDTSISTLEALLGYHLWMESNTESSRDKTDLIATCLFRARFHGVGESPNDDLGQVAAFVKHISSIPGLEHKNFGALPEDYRSLLSEFTVLRAKVQQFNRFDQIVDSGTIQLARDLKERFGRFFYHPHVLARVAHYNAFFRRRFDALFLTASEQIRAFARMLQNQEVPHHTEFSELSAQQLAQLTETELLRVDYARAENQFRKVSRLKKAADRKQGAKISPLARTLSGLVPLPALDKTVNVSIENEKLQNMLDQIKTFVAASDALTCSVPLQNTRVLLGYAEVQAFRSDFGSENSFRARYASAIRRLVGIQARICSELQVYETRMHCAYLWKPHAAALAWLLHTACNLDRDCLQVSSEAQKRGLLDKAMTLEKMTEKLRNQVHSTANILHRASQEVS